MYNCIEMTPVVNKTELIVPNTCVLLNSRAAECNTHASCKNKSERTSPKSENIS